MTFWKKLFGEEEQAVDYYEEGLQLLRGGHYHEALTSFRLALRDAPSDVAVLQQIAITYTRIGMTDEALKTYRSVLDHDPKSAGAHYGMAFLLLHHGRSEDAVQHLRAFLATPPTGPDADRHIGHARRTLAELTGEAVGGEAH